MKKKKLNFFWETPFDKKPLKDFFEPFELRLTLPGIRFPEMNAIPIHMSEAGNKILIRAELPGFKKDEISLNATENTIDIRAAKRREKISKTERTFHQEQSASMVNRSFTLPESIDPNKTEAKIEDGILTIELTRADKIKKKKKIEIT